MERKVILGPTTEKQRFIILDALRGLALLGICLANLPEFSLWTFLSGEEQAAMSTLVAVPLVGKTRTDGTHELHQSIHRRHHPLLWNWFRHGAWHGLVASGANGYRHLCGTDNLLPCVDEVVQVRPFGMGVAHAHLWALAGHSKVTKNEPLRVEHHTHRLRWSVPLGYGTP